MHQLWNIKQYYEYAYSSLQQLSCYIFVKCFSNNAIKIIVVHIQSHHCCIFGTLLYQLVWNSTSTMKKMGVFQLALQLNFWVAKDICNSLYLYVVNANRQVAWVVELQLVIYIMQLIVTQLQLCQKDSFSFIIQFHYNYTHDVMSMSLIVIYLLTYDTWYYEDFST
jgi:hypothetical protein